MNVFMTPIRLGLFVLIASFFIAQNAWSVRYDITQLTDNDFTDKTPQINKRDEVVWWGHDGNDYEIFLATPLRGKGKP